VARDPGCCATLRIHPSPKEDAIEHAYSPLARSAKPELSGAYSEIAVGFPDPPG
jgi:hypothetical protein